MHTITHSPYSDPFVISPRSKAARTPALVRALHRREFKAVLWDLDGTLVDSEGSFQAQAFTRSMEIVHGVTPPLNALGIPHTVGKTPDEIFADMCNQAGMSAGQQLISELMATRQLLLKEAIRQGVRLMPAVKQLLSTWRQHGIRLAVASQSPQWQAELVVEHAGIAPYFDLVIGGDAVPRERRKPMPDLYQLAAGQLGLSTRQCLVLEDTIIGATAGVRAGCHTILIPTIYNRHIRSLSLPTLHGSLANTGGLLHLLGRPAYLN